MLKDKNYYVIINRNGNGSVAHWLPVTGDPGNEKRPDNGIDVNENAGSNIHRLPDQSAV